MKTQAKAIKCLDKISDLHAKQDRQIRKLIKLLKTDEDYMDVLEMLSRDEAIAVDKWEAKNIVITYKRVEKAWTPKSDKGT